MSFRNAAVLLEVAAMISADRYGTTLSTIEERLGKDRRSIQRLVAAMRLEFPDMEEFYDEDGLKRLRLRRPMLCDLVGVTAEQLAALDLAVDALEAMQADARPLLRLRDDIRSLMPDAAVRRLDPDADAILEAHGFVARPGPRQIIDQDIDEAVTQALKGCRHVEFDYASNGAAEPTRRRVAPLGVLSGLRRYLVGRPTGRGSTVRTYRLDKVLNLEIVDEGFERPADFDLHVFARRSFGAFFAEHEYADVVWRFAPEAAAAAKGFRFHPDQNLEDQEDGSLIVRFKACGHLEMAWHLYSWGDKVEVIEPRPLREMVSAHRRSDFTALP